jgi:superfamily I DNA/RNA helicase/RecB family exonuclease
MECDGAQELVVNFGGPRLRVLGEAGSGKTSALVQRWLSLAASERPDRVLVLCATRAAAHRFRKAGLAGWTGGADALPVTTWHGAAFDLLRRHGDERWLLNGAEQGAVVARLLAAEGAAEWLSCGSLLGRAAFGAEVAAAVSAVETAGLPEARILAAADAAGVGPRWRELLAFVGRYQASRVVRGAVDGPGLIAAAAALLDDASVAEVERARWSDVLVDDAQALTPVMAMLLERLAPARLVAAGDPCLAGGRWFEAAREWGSDVDLGPSRRAPAAPELIHCHHPAVEPDAIAAELLGSHQAGVSWAQMAVLVRRDRERAGVGRALARYRIPARLTPGPLAEEPVIRAIVDLLAWAAGDQLAQRRLLASPLTGLDPGQARNLMRASLTGGAPLARHPRLAALYALRDSLAPRLTDGGPVELVWEVWRLLQPELVADPDAAEADPASSRAVDAVVAFMAGLSERVRRDPSWRIADEVALMDNSDLDVDPSREPGPDQEDAVAITSIAQSAGCEWHTVVVAGCLEGELPRVSGFVRYFDRELLGAGRPASAPLPTVAARRLASLDEERRLFTLASSRATGRLIGTAAPQPGQLISRWVGSWPVRPPALSMPTVEPVDIGLPMAAMPTPGAVPVHPDRRLTLSASQLTTYDDCPLRYAFQYELAVRSEAGVWASMGQWVHDALAEFADPEGPADRSWERLQLVADAHWSDTIALYQPQREEIRRDVFAMLEGWWNAEWGTPPPPDVLAVERPFHITVGEHEVVGRIDRIDRVAGGIAVIDYKTGRTVPKADDVVNDLQLATYHLAAIRDPALSDLGPPVALRLLYLRDMVEREQPITQDHETVTEARILATAARILSEEFLPRAEADCDHCDFHRLCPLQPEGREVGVQ